jgi:hypothetical protein
MYTLRFLVGFALVLMVVGCGRSGELLDQAVPPDLQHVLDEPDRVTLYTLLTTQDVEDFDKAGINYEELPRYLTGSDLHSVAEECRILGQTELDSEDAGQLISTFTRAVNNGEKVGVACFQPHHAIRVEKGGATLDILICFKCMNYLVLPGGGYNNVHMIGKKEMEGAWRATVRKHGLRDISDKEK